MNDVCADRSASPGPEEIKNGLIEYLEIKNPDAVFASEISVVGTHGVRVADLIMATKRVHAFEIKGPKDTFKRLDGQLRTYSELFDYVWLVYWKDRFEENAEKSCPPHVGLMAVSRNAGGGLKFTLRRKAKISPLFVPDTAARFFWKSEIRYLLWKEGSPVSERLDKERTAEAFLARLSKHRIREAVRFVLKNRFKHASPGQKVDVGYIAKLWWREWTANNA